VQGFMRQRGDSWELRVYVGRDLLTGQKRYAHKTFKGAKREAQRELAAMVTDVERRVSVRSKLTVGELLEDWFEHARRDFSPKTVREVRGFLDRNLVPSLGAIKASKLTVAEVDRYYRELQRAGGRGGTPLSPGTIRRLHGILRRAFSQGVRWGWLTTNPVANAAPPRVVRSDMVTPSPQDLARVLDCAAQTDPALAAFLTLAAATGARRSELLALRWKDVDLERRVLTVERAIVHGPDGLVEKDTKTHQGRKVSLDNATALLLDRYRAQLHEQAERLDTELVADSLVFSNHGDGVTPWFPDSITRAFRRTCRRAGLNGVRLHDLRHYVATQLLAGGVDVRTVAGRLGHRDAATTLNVYAHFLEEADRGAADLLARRLRPLGTDAESAVVSAAPSADPTD
jgi:integrase